MSAGKRRTVIELPNKTFDTDTQRYCAAWRAGEHAPRGAMPLRAGQLRRYVSSPA